MSRYLLPLLLAACTPVRPVPPEQPMPVRVDCQQHETADVPAWPSAWLIEGPAWGLQVLGILEEERKLRGEEQGCIFVLKAKGVIR